VVQDARSINRTLVLTELLRQRPTTRSRIAKSTGISATTVSRIVDGLKDDGVVHDISDRQTARRGRPAILVDVVPELGYVAGVDIGATTTRTVIADLVGKTVARFDAPTPAEASAQDLGEWAVAQAEAAAGPLWDRVTHLAFGVPGAVGAGQSAITNAPNLRQVEDEMFLAALHRAAGRPISVDNDANYALVGEQKRGAARQAPTAAMLTIGTGLGVALAIDGRIIRGRRGLVGEYGYLPVGPLGTRLEHLITGPNLTRYAQERGIELRSPAELFSARPGPDLAGLRAQFDQALLVALTAVIVSNEPAVIVLGGGIAHSLGPHLTDYEAALERNLQVRTPLQVAELGDFSGATGAAITAVQRAYSALGVRDEDITALPR